MATQFQPGDVVIDRLSGDICHVKRVLHDGSVLAGVATFADGSTEPVERPSSKPTTYSVTTTGRGRRTFSATDSDLRPWPWAVPTGR